MASGTGSTPVQGRDVKVHIADGHTKPLGLKPEASRSRNYEESKNHGHIRKNKDPKSFTQNLFDTVAMRLLHRPKASDSHPPWAPSNERTQLAGSSNLDTNILEPKVYEDVSRNGEKDAENRRVSETEYTKAPHSYNPPQVDSVSDIAFVESNTTFSDVSASIIAQASTKLETDLENLETSGDDEKAYLDMNNAPKLSVLGAITPTPKISLPDSQSEGLGSPVKAPLQKTSVSAESRSTPTLGVPAQSLSHFTMENIVALREARAACRSDLHEQHYLLKSLGRTDLPRQASTCGSYGDFLAYSGQSMTYILSNVDALLQSFLHCDDSNAACKVVRSYDFALIVDLFRRLRRIDMHPHKIFPSLWISAGRLYPVSAAISKRRPLTDLDLGLFSFDSPPTSQDPSLNDLESCHLIKIILAALVASVPKCSPIGWLAVRKLHASGQVAPFIDADNSPAERKMIGKLVRTLHAFENETALNLVIRLARSIDIRCHLARARALAEDTEKNRGQFPFTFSRVIDYVNADSLKICVANHENQPSVKGGDWIDPQVEPITWHPREWPIIIEWLRAVILKEWDGRAEITKGSAVGGALGLMSHIRK